MSERLSKTVSIRLMHSTLIVVRPIAVFPTSFGPVHLN